MQELRVKAKLTWYLSMSAGSISGVRFESLLMVSHFKTSGHDSKSS